MGGADFYSHDDFNVLCDASGFKCKASDTVMTWDGKRVHKDFFEERHPQDFVRGRVDRMRVENSRPESTDVFVTTNQVQASDL